MVFKYIENHLGLIFLYATKNILIAAYIVKSSIFTILDKKTKTIAH